MSFGRNPFVAKAEAAELKAMDAPEGPVRRGYHLEAAHEWERAAGKEKPGKYRTQYEENAERNRALAEPAAPSAPPDELLN